MSNRLAPSRALLTTTFSLTAAALVGCTDTPSLEGDGAGEARQGLLAAEVPLLSAAALSATSAASAASLGEAAAARRPRPPGDPLLELARGRWLGTCDILLTGQTEPAISVEIERITEPTGVPGEMSWTLIYRDANGEQVRPYTMRADPAVTGRYILDENNGILISNYLQGGNLLYSDFEVQGIRLRTREEFRNNRYEFEIGIGATIPELVSDLGGGFLVNSYRVLNTQKCSMRKVRGHGHGPGHD
jgi:hypothetical protein